METKKHLLNLFIVFYLVFFISDTFANSQEQFNEDLLKGFTYRNLGPFRTGTWITDIAVPESPQKDHLYTFYIASRNGGLWKTVNNGTTFEPLFDNQSVIAIGDVTVAPSNLNIVWVGSGESCNSQSTTVEMVSTNQPMAARPGRTWV